MRRMVRRAASRAVEPFKRSWASTRALEGPRRRVAAVLALGLGEDPVGVGSETLAKYENRVCHEPGL